MDNLKLQFGFEFTDLQETESLKKLDLIFLNSLEASLSEELLAARNNFTNWQLIHSKLAIKLAPLLEQFIAKLFSIEEALLESKAPYAALNKIYECKRNFIHRQVLKNNKTPVSEIRIELLLKELPNFSNDLEFVKYIELCQQENNENKLELASKYAVWACLSEDGQKKHKDGILFKQPNKLDYEHLIALEEKEKDYVHFYQIAESKCQERSGFKLTDEGCKLNFAVDQANYCIHCHSQERDSCSKGMKQSNPLENTLNGCPLDEKISEMNYLQTKGNVIGALAMAIVDNPMLAATGHRICNDCMKSCIYQKQQPVDIPQIETNILKNVLALPWGFEIYSLLTRWNPLSFSFPYQKDDTNAKVLVVGMGPAGFTMAHYLLNEGHIVVGIEGLKIESLPDKLYHPIKDINSMFQNLDERIISGFGGVMEYGITNRWNKNFLLVIRLLLERRKNFKLFGGLRFGSNLTPDQVFSLGFQHIALALGAGSPKLPNLPNILAKGVRTASDFLMSLQLGTAYKNDSLTNLQIRLPVLVIGGGLTALDTATESLAYYPKLLEKFSANYNPDISLNTEEQEIAKEFLAHHEIIKNSNSLLSALKSLGGAKILYRQKLQKSPSYRLNHEELTHGLKEGVEFVENIVPNKILLDNFGHVAGIEATQTIDGKTNFVIIPAKTIFIATGTSPNRIFETEYPEFASSNQYSILGDLDPKYSGNVVKAMASSKHGYINISKQLKPGQKDENFFNQLEELFETILLEVNRLTPNIVELVIKSPLAAQNFKPGQFFRLQNYYDSKMPLMEPLALTGAKVDPKKGEISTIVLEMGGSSNLCAKLPIGKPIILMGPTGTATEINSNENILLIGGGLGNAVLFSIGQALRENNNHVLYFAGYRKLIDRYKVEEIEAAADQIIWCCEEGLFDTNRAQDKNFHGNLLSALEDFAQNNPDNLKNIDRIIVIGSDKMMHALKRARHNILKPYLNPKHKAIASINSPMQCMMKEICGQCLQKHVDPITGTESYVFSCNNQDQDMDRVDFYHLETRLSQNSLLEKFCR